jgi:hypothetical protein
VVDLNLVGLEEVIYLKKIVVEVEFMIGEVEMYLRNQIVAIHLQEEKHTIKTIRVINQRDLITLQEIILIHKNHHLRGQMNQDKAIDLTIVLDHHHLQVALLEAVAVAEEAAEVVLPEVLEEVVLEVAPEEDNLSNNITKGKS